ncbi:MAG: putative membrane protein, partial [Flavobacterium sp.]
FDRIAVPEIIIDDLFIDAFRPIARDGAGNIEVMIRLQKAFRTIASIDNFDLKKASLQYSKQAFERAEIEMKYETDITMLKRECLFAKQ